jgi:hypothetical protein
MNKCGICGKEAEDFTKTKESIFICDTPLCIECYCDFLKKNWNNIFNFMVGHILTDKESMVYDMLEEYNVSDMIYDVIKPKSLNDNEVIRNEYQKYYFSSFEPNKIIRIADNN